MRTRRPDVVMNDAHHYRTFVARLDDAIERSVRGA